MSYCLQRVFASLVWANPPISGEVAAIERLPSEYLRLVARADGIVAFDGALRILGLRESQLPDILQWNEERGWRAAYGGLADDLLFFAENAFGDQYAFEGENIIAFDSETAKKVPVGCTLEEWEASILDNLEAELGISTLRRWRSAGNELAVTQHLCPKYPPAFVLGALGTVENLIALPRSESMRLKGVIARQVHNLPPGSKIGLTVEP